jgi:hypothetical protein
VTEKLTHGRTVGRLRDRQVGRGRGVEIELALLGQQQRLSRDERLGRDVLSGVESRSEWTPPMTSVCRLDEGPLRLDVERRSASRAAYPRPSMWSLNWIRGRSFTLVCDRPGVLTTAGHEVKLLPDGGRRAGWVLFGHVVTRVDYGGYWSGTGFHVVAAGAIVWRVPSRLAWARKAAECCSILRPVTCTT